MFEVVTQDAWYWSCKKLGYDFEIPNANTLQELIPKRATTNSAGYDFRMPFDYSCPAGQPIKIPTGIKWNANNTYLKVNVRHFNHSAETTSLVLEDDDFKESIFIKTIGLELFNPILMLYPRSSLAFEYGFKLLNTTGVIDADYYNNETNQGNIIVGFTVDKPLELKRGDKFCQGVLLPFAYCLDEIPVNTGRSGGIGSTN